jgi:hypothetical protein
MSAIRDVDMIDGYDLTRRAPRWLNCLVCSCGLALTGCFIWRVLVCEAGTPYFLSAVGASFSRLLAASILPFLLLVTVLGRSARRALN